MTSIPSTPPYNLAFPDAALLGVYESLRSRNPDIARQTRLGKADTFMDADYVVAPLAAAAPAASSPKVRYLLFSDPGSHPNAIGEWMVRSRIQDPGRIHIATVADKKDIFAFMRRFLTVLSAPGTRQAILDCWIEGGILHVRWSAQWGHSRVPLKRFKCFRNRSVEDLSRFEIDPHGSYVHWPALDVHLGWEQIQQATDPQALLRARQRSLQFNAVYGDAVRRVREAANLRQSDVPGVSRRHLQRIEGGQSRATASSLESLAAAHGLALDLYMDELACKMKADV